MFLLSLLWVLIGILIGAIANSARLRPASWGQRGWLYMLIAGALLALLGGWLGTLLLGAPFATAMAVWVTVAGVTLMPWLRKLLYRIAQPKSASLQK